MGEAIGGLFGIEKPKPQPVLPPPSPPPTIDLAQERQVTGDRLKFRRGAAATRLAPSGAGSGRVGVYKALGGS
jgi:hypothetical protein